MVKSKTHFIGSRVKRSVIEVKMSGKVGDSFYCACCDLKFSKEADFGMHCNGKKHKAMERVAAERDAAACSIVVRGPKVKGCQGPERLLASYFCQFGLLGRITPLGPVSHGICRVQFMEPGAVARVLQAGHTHHHGNVRLHVTKFEYKPQHGEAARLAHKEEVANQKKSKMKLYSDIHHFLSHASSVEEQLRVVTEKLGLTKKDEQQRQDIARELKGVMSQHYPGCAVYQFGSSVNGFGVQGCDLDLFLHCEQLNIKKEMKNLAKIMSNRGLSSIYGDVIQIPSQRCPIIKFTHKPTGIKCDLSFDNLKALRNSHLLRLYSGSHRVRRLVFALRLWAKFRGLSGGVGGSAPSTLSSYALSLLALFYLMRCKPHPVVPPICDLEDSVPSITCEVIEECQCLVVPEDAQLPPSQNTQPTAELLKGFFHFYSEEVDWEQEALLLKDASSVPRATLAQNFSYLNCRMGAMTVVDPFNLSHNVAGNVNLQFRQQFVAELKRAVELSAQWGSIGDSTRPNTAGLTELFKEPEPAKNEKKTEGNNAQASKVSPKKKGPSAEAEVKSPVRLEGEKENGEFHIILPVSDFTLADESMKKAAGKLGISSEQHWLGMARDFTVNVLETVFMAELEEREGELREILREEKGSDAGNLGKKRSSGHADIGSAVVDTDTAARNGESDSGEILPKKKLCDGASRNALNLVCTTSSSTPLTGTSTTPTTTTTTTATTVTSVSSSTSTVSTTATLTTTVCSTPNFTNTVSSNSNFVTSPTTSTSTSSFTHSPSNPVTSFENGASPTHPEAVPPAAQQAPPVAPMISVKALLCKVRRQVWFGRKKLGKELALQAHPAVLCGSGITLEREITHRSLQQQAALAEASRAAAAAAKGTDAKPEVKGQRPTAQQEQKVKTNNGTATSKSSPGTTEAQPCEDSVKEDTNGNTASSESPIASKESKPGNVTTNGDRSRAKGALPKIDEKTDSVQGKVGQSTNSSSESDSKEKPPEFLVEFACDLVLNEGGITSNHQSPPHLLIKLCPAKDCARQFKLFYDLFRSIMLRLNVSDLNLSPRS